MEFQDIDHVNVRFNNRSCTYCLYVYDVCQDTANRMYTNVNIPLHRSSSPVPKLGVWTCEPTPSMKIICRQKGYEELWSHWLTPVNKTEQWSSISFFNRNDLLKCNKEYIIIFKLLQLVLCLLIFTPIPTHHRPGKECQEFPQPLLSCHPLLKPAVFVMNQDTDGGTFGKFGWFFRVECRDSEKSKSAEFDNIQVTHKQTVQ